MTPRATRELTLYFHELGWRNFQKLCNEVFSHEPNTTSDEYGTPGQGQHGIDLLATIKSSGGGVGQCKCEGSFSGGATVAATSAVFGQEFAELFALPTNQDLGARLDDFARDPSQPLHWAIMDSVIGEVDMPETLRARFIEILRTVDFATLAHVDPYILGPALTFSIRQARTSGDEALMRQLEETIMRLASLASEQASNETTAPPLWQALSNPLLPLAVVPGDEDASARRYFDLSRRFAELSPALATRISPAYMQWVKGLPFAQQVSVWPFIFTLRALR